MAGIVKGFRVTIKGCLSCILPKFEDLVTISLKSEKDIRLDVVVWIEFDFSAIHSGKFGIWKKLENVFRLEKGPSSFAVHRKKFPIIRKCYSDGGDGESFNLTPSMIQRGQWQRRRLFSVSSIYGVFVTAA